MTPRLVVAGYGMVAHRFLRSAVDRGLHEQFHITVVGEEPRLAYDRVRLSAWFEGADDAALSLVEEGFVEQYGIELLLGERVTSIDPAAQQVRLTSGGWIGYDELVLATGSAPFVPPLEGRDLAGCFVYRTIDDLEAIAAWAAAEHVESGVVIGGGLLGLEAANALLLSDVEPHVVEMAPRLMPVQLDDGGGRMLARMISGLGIGVHTGVSTEAIESDDLGRVTALRFADGTQLDTQMVVFSAGIRPRDELAEPAGLARGPRGGFAVDELLRTEFPAISAIGECAAVDGRCYGLVAPGYRMAEVVADRLAGIEPEPFVGADLSTKLKLVGCDVASFGDPHRDGTDVDHFVVADPVRDTYQKLVVDRASGSIVGGVLVGDATAYAQLAAMARGEIPTPEAPASLLSMGEPGAGAVGVAALPDSAPVCSCESVTAGQIREAVDGGCADVGSVAACTKATTGCGGCTPVVKDLVFARLEASGVTVDRSLCRHFGMTRRELFDEIRTAQVESFEEALARFGREPHGCEVCKPAVASMLASMSVGHVLDPAQATLQDTNDWAMANLQKNGTYSVVPRVPGGEITPDQLIALGQIAKDYGLYTKITGGQRVDLFGARLEDLPDIWARVIDAGMESGHAYGKALRTVKSCVGSTWCRYGVQDSTQLAIDLELRYRGLRAPHKLKMAVSGCARECAEAQSKDVGVIATEAGWNLYLGGNGGQRPRHADLFLTDVDTETLVRTIDRFFMFYIRTADRLERTATWLTKLDGGIDLLRQVIVDDSLGICDELDAEMAKHVESYECEWTATLADPDKLSRFTSFVNAPTRRDSRAAFAPIRGQLQPVEVS